MKDKNSNAFDIVRLLAAVSVLISHHYALSGKREPSFFGLTTLGGFSVIVFFSISGFLIAMSAERSSSVKAFFKRRILRILPGLIACSFVMYYIIGLYFNLHNFHAYLRIELLIDFLRTSLLGIVKPPNGFSEGFIHSNAINGSLWTLPIEFSCYVMAWFVASSKRSKILAPAIIVSCALTYFIFKI